MKKMEIKNKFKNVFTDMQKEKNENGVFLNVNNSDYPNKSLYTNLNGNFKDFYETLNVLGQGTMGVVKKALNKKTNEIVAVKIVRSRDEEIIFQIKEEFKNIKKLDNSNIIKSKELYFDKLKGKAYLVMEYFESEELFNYICNIGSYNEIIARKLFKQLLDGINYLHSQGIIHRDLKPNNLLVSKNEENIMKITDFNIAKFNSEYNNYDKMKKDNFEMLTYTGTIAFNAPEKFNKTVYNEVVDCWSAGCVLYTMLVGKQPFYKETIKELIEQIKTNNYDKNCSEWINLTKEAKSLIENLLKTNPKERLTPKEALNHPWFYTKNNSDLSYCISKIKSNHKSLIKKNTFKEDKPNLSNLLNNKFYYTEKIIEN